MSKSVLIPKSELAERVLDSMDRTDLRESLDACRPGSADLALPDLAEARAELERNAALRRSARRAEQFDRSVCGAMQDLAVPAGLKERLLAALAASESSPIDMSANARSVPPRGAAETQRRAAMLVGSAVLALAACLLAMLGVRWYSVGDDWAPRAIAETAVQKFAVEFDPRRSDGWTRSASRSNSFPTSRQLVHDRQPAQRRVSQVAGCSGAAYRLRSPQGALGTLLVLVPRATLTGFPTKPPRSPQSDTAGCAASSWRENDRLYVLVVAGGAKEYRGFLRRPSLVALHASKLDANMASMP